MTLSTEKMIEIVEGWLKNDSIIPPEFDMEVVFQFLENLKKSLHLKKENYSKEHLFNQQHNVEPRNEAIELFLMALNQGADELRNKMLFQECIEQLSLGISIFQSHMLQCRRSKNVLYQVAQLYFTR